MTKKNIIKSYLTPDEYEWVSGQAKLAGLSISTFVKRVCLAQNVRGTVDQEAVLALLRSKGDLGRLGGLLKQHLANADASAGWREELRALLRSIEDTQRVLTVDFNKVSRALLQGKK